MPAASPSSRRVPARMRPSCCCCCCSCCGCGCGSCKGHAPGIWPGFCLPAPKFAVFVTAAVTNKARCPSVRFSKTRCMSGVNCASGPMPAADAGARACSRRNDERGRVARAESAGRRLTAVRKGRAWNTANLAPGTCQRGTGERRGRPRRSSPKPSTLPRPSPDFRRRQWKLDAGEFVWTSGDGRGRAQWKQPLRHGPSPHTHTHQHTHTSTNSTHTTVHPAHAAHTHNTHGAPNAPCRR
mmetsp:Transcript_5331/g.16122  ORF Transcript_5331/g.16122 Transcript_5331/m.16122 type:complete len:240 (+) Transcript_5331:1933-2652(+)